MSSDSREPIHIPTLEELKRCVVPLRSAGSRKPDKSPERTAGTPAGDHDTDKTLSPLSERFLRAAAREPAELSLEERWRSLGVTSGSVKARILEELTGRGFIRLERKGRMQVLHLYESAYEHIGITPDIPPGVGGATHKLYTDKFAEILRRRKYSVLVEKPLGTSGKRIDILALRELRIGVEIGLSSVAQELKNLREDLESGVLDLVIFVAADEKFLEKVRRRAEIDTFLRGQLFKIRFLCVYID